MSFGTSYRVFLGAPSRSDLQSDAFGFRWQTTSSPLAQEVSEGPKSALTPATQQRSFSAIVFPPATLEAASRRISLLYKDLIPDNTGSDEGDANVEELDLIQSFVASQQWQHEENKLGATPPGVVHDGLRPPDIPRLAGTRAAAPDEQPSQTGPTTAQRQDSGRSQLFAGALLSTVFVLILMCSSLFSLSLCTDQTTLYTWPPTAEEDQLHGALSKDQEDELEVQESLEVDPSHVEGPSGVELEVPELSNGQPFQPRSTQSPPNIRQQSASAKPLKEPPSIDLSILKVLDESSVRNSQSSQLTGTDIEESFAAEYSDTSSMAIGRFPHFHFSLHSVVSLAQLAGSLGGHNSKPNTKNPQYYTRTRGDSIANTKASTITRKVDLLLAVLEVDGPDKIKMKKGAQAGTEVSILKLILGDEDGSICRLTAWRETAEEWGGEQSFVRSGKLGEGEMVKRGDVVHIQGKRALTLRSWKLSSY